MVITYFNFMIVYLILVILYHDAKYSQATLAEKSFKKTFHHNSPYNL